VISSYDPRIDSWLRSTLALVSGLVLLLVPATAEALPRQRPLGDVIHVRPGVTCIDDEALREQVRAWLNADAVDADLRVEVEGSNLDGRFVAFRIWRGERLIAQRSFTPGPSECAQLHAVLGLAVALALKVSLRDELLDELAARPSAGWSVGAGATAAWNVVPGVAGGLALWLEKALPEHFSVYLELSGLMSGDTRVKQSSGSFTTSSVAVDAAACVIPVFGESVRGRFCAGLEARTVLATGSGFQISRDALLDWFSIANSAGLSVAILPKWALVGTARLVVPLEKVQIAVADGGGRVVETRDSAAVGGSLSLGAAYEF
jgi:hypothetical protein